MTQMINPPQCSRPEFDPWLGEDPLEEELATHPSILAWRIPADRGAWRDAAHGITGTQTQLSD